MTYTTFSPDGSELLVNMGGEQVIVTGEILDLLASNNLEWQFLGVPVRHQRPYS